jgi:hypothetical protein
VRPGGGVPGETLQTSESLMAEDPGLSQTTQAAVLAISNLSPVLDPTSERRAADAQRRKP